MGTEFQIVTLLTQISNKGVSDVHFRVGKPPSLRMGANIIKTNLEPLTDEDFDSIMKEIVRKENQERISSMTNFDFVYELPGVSRFRVNYCRDLGMPKLTMRLVPLKIPTIEELGLPGVIRDLTNLNNGIIMITGPTGSGKSTTMASIIDTINENHQKHIVTIEDPVEFMYVDKKSLVTQRSLGIDVETFSSGIKFALRQDPDVILVGEIRDRDTMENAMAAAETGHLVLATIHTNSAVQTINRIVNLFDESTRVLASERIASCLRATIAQKLIPKIDGGRSPAIEIMTVTSTVKDYILKRNVDEIYTIMRRGEYSSMKTMNTSLYELYDSGKITKETALAFSDDRTELSQMMSGVYHGTAKKIKDKIV